MMQAADGEEFVRRLYQLGVRVPGMNSTGAINWSAELTRLIGPMDETARAIMGPFVQWAVQPDGKTPTPEAANPRLVRARLQQLRPALQQMQSQRSDAAVIARVRQTVAEMEAEAGTTEASPADHTRLGGLGTLLLPVVVAFDAMGELFTRNASKAVDVAEAAVNVVRPEPLEYLRSDRIRKGSSLAVKILFGIAASTYLLALTGGGGWARALFWSGLVVAALITGLFFIGKKFVQWFRSDLLPFMDRGVWECKLYEQVRVSTRLLGFASLDRVVALGLIPEVLRAVDIEQRKTGLQYKLFDEDADVVIEALFREHPNLSVFDIPAWERIGHQRSLFDKLIDLIVSVTG